jgi:hypothetical protein
VKDILTLCGDLCLKHKAEEADAQTATATQQ